MHTCIFCNKECKNNNSLSNHQTRCKENPNRKNPSVWAARNRKGIPSWNKGLIGDERLKHSDETKKKISEKTKQRSVDWNRENGKRISEAIRKKVSAGTWHTSLAKHMHIDYKGNNLHGSWELKYVMYLDENNIKWIRNKDSFTYLFEGKERKYTPDFYLPESDEYIEIKGYKTEKDSAKWSQFPFHRKLKILMKQELISLGIKL